MTKENIADQIEALLEKGLGYQAAYDTIAAKYPKRELDVAELVAKRPNLQQRQRLAIPRKVGIVLLVLGIVAQAVSFIAHLIQDQPLLYIFEGMQCLVMGLCFEGAMRWSKRAWLMLSGLSVWMEVFYLVLGEFDDVPAVPITLVALFALIILVSQLMYWQMGGSFQMSSYQEQDEQGRIWARFKIKFADEPAT